MLKMLKGKRLMLKMKWERVVDAKILNNEMIDLKKDLPLKIDLWITNFLKSALSTTLIALAFNFIFEGLHSNPNDEVQILLGIVSFLIAMLCIFIIDVYHEKVRRYEITSIENNQKLTEKNVIAKCDTTQKLCKNYVDTTIEKIIEKKINEIINTND